mmetsp:Transcript_5804/g.16281  ORF Transcript_5804/g.16281 Transcript_5804/m.16281 type:complete len:258 (+) Transcript_5804:293-1066(+)
MVHNDSQHVRQHALIHLLKLLYQRLLLAPWHWRTCSSSPNLFNINIRQQRVNRLDQRRALAIGHLPSTQRRLLGHSPPQLNFIRLPLLLCLHEPRHDARGVPILKLLLQRLCHHVHIAPRLVVAPRVPEHEPHVLDKLLGVLVLTALQRLLHAPKVHRLLHLLRIVGVHLGIHGRIERPGPLVRHDRRKDLLAHGRHHVRQPLLVQPLEHLQLLGRDRRLVRERHVQPAFQDRRLAEQGLGPAQHVGQGPVEREIRL